MTVVPFSNDRRKALRRAWLGAAAAASLGGAGLGDAALGFTSAYAAEAAGPASFADIVDRVRGAVVSVKVKLDDVNDDDSDLEGRSHPFMRGGPIERFFRRFGFQGPGDLPPPPRERGVAQGSGFFVTPDGYIVTNNHVVEHASDVTVTLDDGKVLAAKVIGTDAKTDLALLKADGSGYPAVSFAAKPPRVGDWVIAVGNPFGLGGSVTAGIVSARGRDLGSGPYDDFIQIDAPVNHGNSGGPTFNNEGEVVGVNTAIFSPSGGSVGIGFAIAADVVQSVVQQLRDHGAVARGYLGVQIQRLTPDLAESFGVKADSGALVAKEPADSPAAQAGVKAGDVITAVNDEPVGSPRELSRRIAGFGPKTSVTLTLARGGKQQKIDVTLGAMPSDRAVLALADPVPPASEDATSALAGLGLELRADKDGVRVSGIKDGGAAAEHGLAPGDEIVDAGGNAVKKPEDVAAAIDDARNAGRRSVLLRVRSDQSERYVALPVKKVF